MASDTPMMDELEKGPWPSFVTEIKRAADKKESAGDLLRSQEACFQEKQGLWKHGGIVGVKGYGGGVIGRYHQRPEEFPHLQACCLERPPAKKWNRIATNYSTRRLPLKPYGFRVSTRSAVSAAVVTSAQRLR